MLVTYSSVQNILLRFGFNNHLNFVLGPRNVIGFGERPIDLKYFDELNETAFPWHRSLASTQGYDIWAMHTIWNKTVVRNEVSIFCLIQFKSYHSVIEMLSVIITNTYELTSL